MRVPLPARLTITESLGYSHGKLGLGRSCAEDINNNTRIVINQYTAGMNDTTAFWEYGVDSYLFDRAV